MSFRETLIKLRTEKKLSQQELADMLDVSRQTVSRWEAGKNIPSPTQIANICRVFNIQANELVGMPAESEGKPTSVNADLSVHEKIIGKAGLPLFIAIGIILLLAVAGLIVTIIYAVKDSAYDTSSTVWIASIPQNTPFIILSVFIAIFIVVVAALFIYLLRGRKK